MQGFLLFEIDPKQIEGLEEQVDGGSNLIDHTILGAFTLSDEADSDMALCWLRDRSIHARMDIEFDIETSHLRMEADVDKIPTTRITLTLSVPDPKNVLCCGMWSRDNVRAGVLPDHPHEGVLHKLIKLVVNHGDHSGRVKKMRILLIDILRGKERPGKGLEAWII